MSAAGEAWWWPYVMIIVAGWLATDVWRWIGVLVSGRLREDSEILAWVKAVATALVAGVIARLILFPAGALESAPMWLRLIAAVAGFAIFLAVGQRLIFGIVAAEAILIGGWFALGL